MNVTAMNTDLVANDLTQLSSREQLSALMDGALPADQTRFLLRRLQHDASLAECWERWRLTGEVMRGLAPAQRLPADFAARVSAALHGEATPAVSASTQVRKARVPAWVRWGGGAAMAASLAVVAVMVGQPAADAPLPQVAAASATRAAPDGVPAAPTATLAIAEQDPVEAGQAAQAVAAAAMAAASRQDRAKRDREVARAPALVAVAAPKPAPAPALAIVQPDIVTRPWPRSILPQYSQQGVTVGFGGPARGAVEYNPFQAQAGIGDLPPPSAGTEAAATEPAADAPAAPRQAEAGAPQP